MNLFEASEVFSIKRERFPEMVESVIQGSSALIADYISDQLYSGKDGDEKDLTPDYLNDPYFAKYGANRMRAAQGYKAWKMKITPPIRSFIGLAPRKPNVPNLYINGYYHSKITTDNIDGGLRIGNNAGFADEVESKYGKNIFKVSKTARAHFIKEVLEKELINYWKD